MKEVKSQENIFFAELFDIILSPDFFFNEAEMETVTGVHRTEWEECYKKICEAENAFVFGRLDDGILHSAMASITGYPHKMDAEILKRVDLDVSQDDTFDILEQKCAKHRIRLV